VPTAWRSHGFVSISTTVTSCTGSAVNTQGHSEIGTLRLTSWTASVPPPYRQATQPSIWIGPHALPPRAFPSAGHFECSFDSVKQRERHDNASLTPDAIAHVRKKFTKEEKLFYHILFPRFIWAFIPGLFLALITWIAPKGRPGNDGRLCVDPSTILDSDDEASPPNDGAANAQLPRTGATDKEDENPPVYYGTAFMRFLIWIYNLRIDHPTEYICLSANDITAAFCRLLHHPDMAKLWDTVFQEFLVIPCGMIFGGRNIGIAVMFSRHFICRNPALSGSDFNYLLSVCINNARDFCQFFLVGELILCSQLIMVGFLPGLCQN